MNVILKILLVLSYIKIGHGLYDSSSTNLTDFPLDIPAHESRIVLENNKISKIDVHNLEHLNVLSELCLEGNLLGELPDITPVATTLTELLLSKNVISNVNPAHLKGVQKLDYLDISYNKLTVFPDLGDAKLTLGELKINFNMIAVVPPDSFIGYSRLGNINFGVNKMTYIPNSCNYNMWANIILIGGARYLRCDCKILHLFVNPHHTFHYWECYSPANLAGRSLDASSFRTSLSLSQLTCDGLTGYHRKHAAFSRVKTNYYCAFPFVVQRHRADSVIQCATICVTYVGCYYFNVQRLSEGVICDITDIKAKQSDIITNVIDYSGWHYYSLM